MSAAHSPTTCRPDQARPPKPLRELCTTVRAWDRRKAATSTTFAQTNAANLVLPESAGSAKLFCASALLQFSRVIPESLVEAALRSISHSRLMGKLESAIADSDIRILAAIESWFPMREIARATHRQVEAVASARTLAELHARTVQWTRSPDTPLQVCDTYAYFLIGICDIGTESVPAPSARAGIALAETLRSRLGTAPRVRFQIHTEFLDGLRTTIWDCQSLRLLAIARKLLVASAAGIVRVDLTPVLSADSHTINVAFHADQARDDLACCYLIEGHPRLTPTLAAALLGEQLATVQGVIVQAGAETPRSEHFRCFKALQRAGVVPAFTQRL